MHDTILRLFGALRLSTAIIALTVACLAPAWAASYNPKPCPEWLCSEDARITKVTVDGPAKLKVGEAGTWKATATTAPGKQVCKATGATQDCPVRDVTWEMKAGDKTENGNSITRSWDKPGKYLVMGTGLPVSNCCTGTSQSGQMYVDVGCAASTNKYSYEMDIAQVILGEERKLEEWAKKIYWVKEFKISLFGKIFGEKYEKCCNDTDESPTVCWSLGGSGGVKGVLSVYVPGVGGKVLKYFRVPGWLSFGSPGVFIGSVEGGLFGGLSGTGAADVTYNRECGNCIKYDISGRLDGFFGLAAALKGDLIYDDGTTYKCEASAQGYLQAGIKFGLLGGKLLDCANAPKIDFCYSKAVFKIDLAAFCHDWDYGLKVSHTWELWEGTCP